MPNSKESSNGEIVVSVQEGTEGQGILRIQNTRDFMTVRVRALIGMDSVQTADIAASQTVEMPFVKNDQPTVPVEVDFGALSKGSYSKWGTVKANLNF